jgi:hypothetical protein
MFIIIIMRVIYIYILSIGIIYLDFIMLKY